MSTPGYLVAPSTIINDPNASISYSDKWPSTRFGPVARPLAPAETFYNGALIYLNSVSAPHQVLRPAGKAKHYPNSVIVQGAGQGTDARFTAEIKSMGRLNDGVTAERARNKTNSDKSATDSKEKTSDGGEGVSWELIGSIIGAVSTIVGAILGVYLAQGKWGEKGSRNTDDESIGST